MSTAGRDATCSEWGAPGRFPLKRGLRDRSIVTSERTKLVSVRVKREDKCLVGATRDSEPLVLCGNPSNANVLELMKARMSSPGAMKPAPLPLSHSPVPILHIPISESLPLPSGLRRLRIHPPCTPTDLMFGGPTLLEMHHSIPSHSQSLRADSLKWEILARAGTNSRASSWSLCLQEDWRTTQSLLVSQDARIAERPRTRATTAPLQSQASPSKISEIPKTVAVKRESRQYQSRSRRCCH